MTNPRPEFHSSCMQCSHWGHLIQLTSAGAPCTECAARNLGASIIPQLTSPWHLQTPIYSRFEVFCFFFPFPSFPSPTKRSKYFLPSQTRFEPVPHHWKIQTILCTDNGFQSEAAVESQVGLKKSTIHLRLNVPWAVAFRYTQILFLRTCNSWNFVSPITEGKEKEIHDTSTLFWAYHTHYHI